MAFAASWTTLHTVTWLVYGLGPDGVPDAGFAPLALVPWLFWIYRSGGLSLWTDSGIFAVWLLACLILVVPSGLGMALTRNAAQRAVVLLLALVQGAVAATSIWSWRVALYFEAPYSADAARELFKPAWAWAGCLILMGVVLGCGMTLRRSQAAWQANPALQPTPQSRRG